MGTHGALLICSGNGEVHRYEATLDGWKLVDFISEWSLHSEAEPGTVHFGSGQMEIDGDGEGDQVYAALLDFRHKKYFFSWRPEYDKDLEVWIRLRSLGWSLDGVDSKLMLRLAGHTGTVWPFRLL